MNFTILTFWTALVQYYLIIALVMLYLWVCSHLQSTFIQVSFRNFRTCYFFKMVLTFLLQELRVGRGGERGGGIKLRYFWKNFFTREKIFAIRRRKNLRILEGRGESIHRIESK